jgi:asparagine synthase (glutamine-hydrolysing)
MCGIAGVWMTTPGSLDRAEASLDSVLATLVHRGPDDHGTWTDPQAGLVLGHRRLAIIDLSPLGHQPMVGPESRTAIVFNGEIYNFPELRRELESKGFAFTSESDTEVLLHGYRCWGERVLDRLVGMFAFAVWDKDRRQLFMARDRAGEKPLYYAAGPWGFAFASEIGGLAALPGIDLTIDQDALSLYLQYQYVPAPHTIYRGIRKLPPGHAMRVGSGTTEIWRYWDPVPLAIGPRMAIAEPDALEELERLLRDAVRGQMLSDVPLGAFLSGGIDSTAVVAMMAELSSSQVRTFTIGFDIKQYDESPHADRVARHLGVNHTVEYLSVNDALTLIPKVPGMYGEPFSDSSALPTRLVSQIARKHVTVCLSGDGGDEAFGGYSRYDEMEKILLMTRLTWPLTSVAKVPLSGLPGRLGRGGQLLGESPEDVYRARVGVFRTTDVQTMQGRLPPFVEYERAWASASEQPVRQRAMLADLLSYLPEAVLVKVDRAAMNVSLETRAPLLDHRVLEFALQLPAAYTYRKRLLKQLVYRRVPRSLVDRPKQGFGIPLGHWFRTELRDLVMDMLTPARMDAVGIHDYSVVKRLLTTHMSGTVDEYPRLWSLLVLSLWHDSRRGDANLHESLQLATV